MGYIAVKGGKEAIDNARKLVQYYRLKSGTKSIEVKQLMGQFRLGIDKVMGEGSLYSTEYGALALKQSEGDVLEAAFILRAFRATLSRNFYSEPLDTRNMQVIRRISASFREIPGGQVLGPTRDYTQRLLDTELAFEADEEMKAFFSNYENQLAELPKKFPRTFSKVIDILKEQGLLKEVSNQEDNRLMDITREAVRFPAPRSARLQMMARGETGSIMALGYSAMRGYGAVHPTVGELRVGHAKIHITDRLGHRRYIGKILVTEAEMASQAETNREKNVPYIAIGYGLCFGQNETKAICMGILDRAMRKANKDAPANDQEFVLYHTEGIEAMGFTNHLKLPHYVTFQSELKNLRKAMARKAKVQ
jgi:alpha-D-ribose 1-methylphosphonate 5-triphosphate synthase subunit PhnI